MIPLGLFSGFETPYYTFKKLLCPDECTLALSWNDQNPPEVQTDSLAFLYSICIHIFEHLMKKFLHDAFFKHFILWEMPSYLGLLVESV